MKNLKPRFQAITSTLSCTFVLLLTGLTVLSVLVARNIREQQSENLVVALTLGGSDEVLLNAEESMADLTTRMIDSLHTERFVKEVKLISADEVLAEQSAILGGDPLEFLGFNPFHNELEVSIQSAYANSDSMLQVTQELVERYPLISEMNYEKDLLDNLTQNTRRITYALTALTVLLLVILLTLINNMVHLGIYARRFHIYTMKLVGASWSFIRRPFIRRSLTIGLVSGVLADALLVAFIRWMVVHDEAFALYATHADILLLLLAVPLVGLLLLLVCTYVSVNHFIKMKEKRLYE